MTRQISFLVLLLMFLVSPLYGETIHVDHAAVSSRSDIASEVGREILENGGNAVDAAVAVEFALSVTYPSAGNLGGGGFLILARGSGEVKALDFREKAPAAAHRDMFLDESGEVDRALARASRQSSGVPGTVAGLLLVLDQYGTMSRQEVMAPAIRLAEEGFVLNEDLANQFRGQFNNFRRYPASLAKFSKDGSPYSAGDLWTQPDLADTLKQISSKGRDGFYKGPVAELLVTEMQNNNGLITHQDLADYEPVWREPIHGTFRGYDIWSMPAPSSGGILLVQMLNMLEPYDLASLGWSSKESSHLIIEAQRRAYADRAEYLGDPDYIEIPTATLTSKQYARSRFSDFNPDMASDSDVIGAGQWPVESPDTTHYSVIDSDGNAVAVTTTLNSSYGNKIVVPGAGFLLNNEMDDFSSKPNTPNSYGLIGRIANEIQPGKRMLSSMTPTIVTKDKNPVLITGSPGGSTIINTVLHVVLNVLEYGMSLEEAVSSPRFSHQWKPNVVRVERGAINDEALSALEEIGHQGLNVSRFPIGDANSILLDENYIEAVSDPRNVGGVAGY